MFESERTYNVVRLHQTLNRLTLLKLLEQGEEKSERKRQYVTEVADEYRVLTNIVRYAIVR